MPVKSFSASKVALLLSVTFCVKSETHTLCSKSYHVRPVEKSKVLLNLNSSPLSYYKKKKKKNLFDRLCYARPPLVYVDLSD